MQKITNDDLIVQKLFIYAKKNINILHDIDTKNRITCNHFCKIMNKYIKNEQIPDNLLKYFFCADREVNIETINQDLTWYKIMIEKYKYDFTDAQKDKIMYYGYYDDDIKSTFWNMFAHTDILKKYLDDYSSLKSILTKHKIKLSKSAIVQNTISLSKNSPYRNIIIDNAVLTIQKLYDVESIDQFFKQCRARKLKWYPISKYSIKDKTFMYLYKSLNYSTGSLYTESFLEYIYCLSNKIKIDMNKYLFLNIVKDMLNKLLQRNSAKCNLCNKYYSINYCINIFFSTLNNMSIDEKRKIIESKYSCVLTPACKCDIPVGYICDGIFTKYEDDYEVDDYEVVNYEIEKKNQTKIIKNNKENTIKILTQELLDKFELSDDKINHYIINSSLFSIDHLSSLDHNICMKYACISNNKKLITYFLDNKLILPNIEHILFSFNTKVNIETLQTFYKYGLCFDKKLMYFLYFVDAFQYVPPKTEFDNFIRLKAQEFDFDEQIIQFNENKNYSNSRRNAHIYGNDYTHNIKIFDMKYNIFLMEEYLYNIKELKQYYYISINNEDFRVFEHLVDKYNYEPTFFEVISTENKIRMYNLLWRFYPNIVDSYL